MTALHRRQWLIMKGPDSKDVEMLCVIGVDIVSEKWQRRKALTGFAICVALLYNILSQMTLFYQEYHKRDYTSGD